MADLESLIAQAGELRRAGRVPEAIAAYERLLGQRPALPDSWYNLALMYRRARRFDDALAAYDQALAHGLSGPEEAHLNRGVIYADDLRRPDLAERELAAALALNPRYVPALLNLGNLHEDRGRRAEAREAYQRVLALEADHPLALARVAGLHTPDGPDDPMIGRVARVQARPGLGPADKAELLFSLGRLQDLAGVYNEAYARYHAANAFSRQSGRAPPYDRAAQERLVDQLIAAFPAAEAVPPGAPQRPPGWRPSGGPDS